MQATVDSAGLKHLTRALHCLSKYGEDVVIIATPETFAISSTNQALTAYGRFKYAKSFFNKYRVDGSAVDSDAREVPTIACQVVTKPLLQILKHKTIEKSCEKCELVISDGASQPLREDEDNEDRDTLESRLTVRLHCKHGVVKTHRIPLNAASNLMSPSMPDAALESHVTIGPKPLRYLLEHFPFGKGSKTDPQLIWVFHDTEVQLRSLESAVDAKGRTHLTTELTISAEEFEEYELQATPVTIAFHLREFNATIAFAEASSLSLELRFTDPDAPLYIDVGGDLADTMFVIATCHLQSFSPQSSQTRQAIASAQSKGKKRPLEEDAHQGNAQAVERERIRSASAHRPAKPMKVVHRADHASIACELNPAPSVHDPPPSWAILTAAQTRYKDAYDDNRGGQPSQPLFGGASQSQPPRRESAEREPLFLPESQLSQLPPAAEAAIIESGLGIENMTAEELEDMLEGDAEEVEFSTQRSRPAEDENMGHPRDPEREDMDDWRIEGDEVMDDGGAGYEQNADSFELIDDIEMEPTQNDGGTKVFRPLFED
ncbi:Rad9-domain-containing protein [Trametes polyzona]|nr:Rad9-domain-containing protein [Trametes polyzona]